MSAPVEKLKSDQCAVRIGTPVIPLGKTTITFVKPTTGSEYEAVIKFNFKPDAEYDPDKPDEKLPEGTDFAVLNLKAGIITNSKLKVGFSYRTVGVNDFEIDLGINAETIPADKGNHG